MAIVWVDVPVRELRVVAPPGLICIGDPEWLLFRSMFHLTGKTCIVADLSSSIYG